MNDMEEMKDFHHKNHRDNVQIYDAGVTSGITFTVRIFMESIHMVSTNTIDEIIRCLIEDYNDRN